VLRSIAWMGERAAAHLDGLLALSLPFVGSALVASFDSLPGRDRSLFMLATFAAVAFVGKSLLCARSTSGG
jgi:hypothetical protein